MFIKLKAPSGGEIILDSTEIIGFYHRPERDRNNQRESDSFPTNDSMLRPSTHPEVWIVSYGKNQSYHYEREITKRSYNKLKKLLLLPSPSDSPAEVVTP